MIAQKLSRAKLQQADFWPELAQPSLVFLAHISYLPSQPGGVERSDASRAAMVKDSEESPLGKPCDNAVHTPITSIYSDSTAKKAKA